MANKKRKQLSATETKLDILVSSKISLLKNLSEVYNRFNHLSDDSEVDNWIYSLPIENSSDLVNPNRKSRLGNAKNRQVLRKNSIKILDQIEDVETEIRLTYLDVLSEKIQSVLSEHE